VTLTRVHEKGTSMTVIIGVDPHKATHTAVAIDRDERPAARVQLVADRCQVPRLLAWAGPLGTERSWAVESAEGRITPR
jgi:transposase